jgi:DNA ligase-associated metallophosphoesterase
MSDKGLTIHCADELLVLHPDRAVYWPARRMLLVADIHFGKAASFRRAGLAVPRGSSEHDLARLGALIEAFGAEHLMVLGDFFHARPDVDEPFMAAFDRWRSQYAGLTVGVAAGNHDRHAAQISLPGVQWCDECAAGPFLLRHEPRPQVGFYVLAGHLHPVTVLKGPGRDRMRLPVFHFRQHLAVLPGFGSFTGGHPVDPEPGDRLYVAGESVLPVPASRRSAK